MRNFKTFMVMFTVMASLTAAFGTMVHHAFTASVKAYGIQPGDVRTLIVAMSIFAVCSGFSAYLLGKAIDWLVWCKQFRKTFGFKAPVETFNTTCADHRKVETVLDSIYRLDSLQKYVRAALLAEKFRFHVQWPAELQAEYARTHR